MARSRRRRGPLAQALLLMAASLCVAALVTVQFLGLDLAWRIRVVGLLPVAVLCLVVWWRGRRRTRESKAIGNRLSRLPADFTVLDDVLVRAPWGTCRVDHVIVSRFGVVVVGAGSDAAWMPEQVEAIRSTLYARGLLQPSAPVRGLVLLPPGSVAPPHLRSDAPVVRVEHVSIQHVAPSPRPVFTSDEVRAIIQGLLQTAQAA